VEFAVVLDEQSKILNCSGSRVVHWGILLSCWVQFDGWEALDVIWDVVGSGINLGNDNLIGEWLEEFTKLVVLRSESLAVTAPRSVDWKNKLEGE
jgi:hypothetical protein